MTSARHHVGVVGGGSWGTTLAHLFADNGNSVHLWVRREEQAREINRDHTNQRYLPGYVLSSRVRATTDLEEVARRCPYIVVAVPSHSIRETAFALGDFVQGDQILVSATKGLEHGTFLRMTEVLKEETCCRKVGALSGPNLAREIMDGSPTGTVIASSYREVVATGAQLLNSKVLRVYGSPDVVGVELAGALKNILAIATGIAKGLGVGDNAVGMLLTRGLAEMSRLGDKAGANPLTFKGLAGIGDIIATCMSPLSRNHRVGLGLAQGKALPAILDEMGQVAEGVKTTEVTCAFARALGVEMPIAQGMYKLLYEGMTPKDAIGELMSRPAIYELDGTPIR
jgi:glycerol-3-phosphate dehydrogenase (NAD(P)+)